MPTLTTKILLLVIEGTKIQYDDKPNIGNFQDWNLIILYLDREPVLFSIFFFFFFLITTSEDPYPSVGDFLDLKRSSFGDLSGMELASLSTRWVSIDF